MFYAVDHSHSSLIKQSYIYVLIITIDEEDIEYIFVLDWKGQVLAHTFEFGFPMSTWSMTTIESRIGSITEAIA